jgi:hypothetical protein
MTTDAMRGIETKHEVYYLASEKVTPFKKLWNKPRFAGTYYFPDELAVEHYALFNILMWRNRYKSPSFQFRFKRLLHMELLKYRKRSYFKQLKRFAVAYTHASTSPLYAMFGKQRNIPIAQDLLDHIKRVNPDMIIYPSSAYDPDGNDIVRIGKMLGIKTLFLIDNWDNLSSKTIFWAFPDHLGVWGRQSKDHAIDIHGFQPEQVTVIGTPRFDDYYGETPPSPFSFQYALFTGQAIPFDELSALRELEIEMRRRAYDYKIIYRPHPWRQARLCDDIFKEAQFKHIILDPQIKDAYYNRKSIQPDLKYYPALLKNAKFVISTPTTMLIESLLCNKHVVLIAYDDGIHLTNPLNALKNYQHFDGIVNIPQVHVCDSKDMLGMSLHRSFDTNGHADVSYYIFNDGRRYKDRLSELVGRLGAEKTSS